MSNSLYKETSALYAVFKLLDDHGYDMGTDSVELIQICRAVEVFPGQDLEYVASLVAMTWWRYLADGHLLEELPVREVKKIVRRVTKERDIYALDRGITGGSTLAEEDKAFFFPPNAYYSKRSED